MIKYNHAVTVEGVNVTLETQDVPVETAKEIIDNLKTEGFLSKVLAGVIILQTRFHNAWITVILKATPMDADSREAMNEVFDYYRSVQEAKAQD